MKAKFGKNADSVVFSCVDDEANIETILGLVKGEELRESRVERK